MEAIFYLSASNRLLPVKTLPSLPLSAGRCSLLLLLDNVQKSPNFENKINEAKANFYLPWLEVNILRKGTEISIFFNFFFAMSLKKQNNC